jgi:hypothetical protein
MSNAIPRTKFSQEYPHRKNMNFFRSNVSPGIPTINWQIKNANKHQSKLSGRNVLY